jgi:hypothetical protein
MANGTSDETALIRVHHTLTDSMQVRFIRPDVALVIAYHTIDDYITPDNVKHANQQNIKSYIIIKEDGKRLMAFDHNNIVQP